MSELAEQAPPKEDVVRSLVHSATFELDRRYGPDSANPLPYHNRYHTENVYVAANLMGEAAVKEGLLESNDVLLLRLAAIYHDIVHGLKPGENEDQSAAEAVLAMQSTGAFDASEITKVEAAIKATKVEFKDGRMQQSASPDDLFQQILCDADLCYLGQMFNDFFWRRALNFYREQLGRQPTTGEIDAFAKYEAKFLRDHHFYTPLADRFFPYKNANIAGLEAGRYKQL